MSEDVRAEGLLSAEKLARFIELRSQVSTGWPGDTNPTYDEAITALAHRKSVLVEMSALLTRDEFISVLEMTPDEALIFLDLLGSHILQEINGT